MSAVQARLLDPRIGALLGGRYELIRLAGRGGMGCVYMARERKTARLRAVKLLQPRLCGDPVWVERFQRESTTTARLHHENIVEVFDYGVGEDGQPWYAMEWLEGETLDRMVQRDGALRWARVRGLALQLCDALVLAHRRGVIHRDLKPSNCMRISRCGDPDRLKVLDFGIALARYDRSPRLTPSGILFGTPGYAAPEQFMGEEVSESADIYAVAVILYQLLAGRMPFVGATVPQLVGRQLLTAPQRIGALVSDSDVPAHVEEVILAGLASDPLDRPANIQVLREALSRVVIGPPPAAPTPGPRVEALAVATPSPAPGVEALPQSGAHTLPHTRRRAAGGRSRFATRRVTTIAVVLTRWTLLLLLLLLLLLPHRPGPGWP